jgi:hypothetical protein
MKPLVVQFYPALFEVKGEECISKNKFREYLSVWSLQSVGPNCEITILLVYFSLKTTLVISQN